MQPLKKYRILAFGQAWAMPYGEMMLADMGADVVKVEPPGIGDHVRKWSRSDLKGMSPHLLAVNRNKRSIVIDLRTDEGRELAFELLAEADALTENFSPGTMAKLGLDYETVHKRCPHLVYCSVSGFGNNGPMRSRPAYDMIMQGEGGFIAVTGTEDGQPAKLGVPVLDVMTAMIAGYSTLCALLDRDQTGVGRYLDIAMLETAASAQGFNVIGYSITGEAPRPMGTAHPLLAPYQVYSTRTVPVSVAVLTDAHWRTFCGLIAREDLIEDARFITAMARIDNRGQLNDQLIPIFLQQTGEYWIDLLDKAGLVVGSVNDLSGVLQHPQLLARKFFDYWNVNGVPVTVPGMPWRSDARGEPVQRMPPELGEHTEEVLRDWLNKDDAAIEHLKASGATLGRKEVAEQKS